MHWQPESPALRALFSALKAEIAPVYLVGGAVRDLLLGRRISPGDLDVVVPHSAIPLARRVADRTGWAFYALDESRDVARLVFSAGSLPTVVDIAALRGGTVQADLLSRDFTVNALALELSPRGADHTLIDHTGGQQDLAGRRIRRVTAASLADDPVRLLRAIRFSVALDFPIEEATRDQILRLGGAIAGVSAERRRDELWKMLASHDPARGVELTRTLGLLPWVLPEVAHCDLVEQSAPHTRDVYRHTLAVVRQAGLVRDWLLGRPADGAFGQSALEAESLGSALLALEPWSYYLRRHFAPPVASGHTRAEWLVWHALLHDIGKPTTRTVETQPDGSPRARFFGHDETGAAMARERLEALRFARQEIELCAAVVRHHMRPHHLSQAFPDAEISRRARYRFFRDAGGADLDSPVGIDVLLTALADFLGTREVRPMGDLHNYLVHSAQMLSFVYSEKGVESPALRPLADGRLLMRELEIAPGPTLGKLIDQLAEAQAAGEIASPDDALRLARLLVANDASV